MENKKVKKIEQGSEQTNYLVDKSSKYLYAFMGFAAATLVSTAIHADSHTDLSEAVTAVLVGITAGGATMNFSNALIAMKDEIKNKYNGKISGCFFENTNNADSSRVRRKA